MNMEMSAELKAQKEGLAGIICNFLCSLETKGAALLDV